MDVYVNDPDSGEQVRRTLVGDEMPTPISVYCDHCGYTDTGDYVVRESMSATARLEVARKWLRSQGWVCGRDGDFCQRCQS